MVGCARFFFFCGVLVWLFLWGFWFCWFLPSSRPGPYFLPGFLCSLFGPTWLQSWFGVRCFWPSSSWPSSPCLSRRCLAGCGFLFLCPFFFLGGVVGFSCSRCVCVVGRVWSGFSVLFLFLGSGFFVGFVGFLFFVFFVFLFLLVSCPLTLPGIVSPFPSPPGSSSGARGFVFSL